MSEWSDDDLARIGGADELQVCSVRPDGGLRPSVTIWVVRSGDHLYVRSAHGPDNGWFVRASRAGRGRVRAGGVERDVRLTPADSALRKPTDEAYHAKYDRYGARIGNTVVGPALGDLTLRLDPVPAADA